MPKKIKKDNLPETTKIAKAYEKNGVESIAIMLASIFVVGMVIVVVVGVGYTFSKKIKDDKAIVDNRPSMAVAIESIDSGTITKKENQNSEIEGKIVVPEETKNSSADINVNVLNNGAPTGSAGKIKDLLVKNGYTKAVAGNSATVSTFGTSVYYSVDKFKMTAEDLAKLLETNNSKATISVAVSTEQKSGDIVIILGK